MSGRWRLAGFTELAELGAGAQGRVVLARHDEGGGQVAIKYLDRRDGDEREIGRLRSEAQMLSRVQDPHVVRLYRFVSGADGAALVMEAVDGVSLKALLADRGALEPEAALAVLKGSLLGLAAAHELDVVHRDYKPANVVVRADGLSKLIDFGIASLSGDDSRTGTPAYMSPEQWRGEPASASADVYAATCVFYECVTGARPYPGGSAELLRHRHLNDPIPVDDVPASLRDLVTRGMAKDAASRPPGAAQFVTELETAATTAYGPDWEQRGIRALSVAAVALAALFPLAALSLGTGTTAATTSAAAATASGGSGGLLAATGAKVAVAVGTAAAVAGGGTAAYVATQEDKPPPTARFAAAISTLNSSTPVPGRPRLELQNAQYVQVSGIQDGALQRRVNAALRGPIDRRLADFRAYIAGPHIGGRPNVPTCARLTTRASVRFAGPKLVSVAYEFIQKTCSVADEELPFKETVTVDARSARVLGPEDVFRDLTAPGVAALARRIPPPSGENRFCVPNPLQVSNLKPRGAEEAPSVQLAFARGGVEFTFAIHVECQKGLVITVPYANLRDLMKPESLALLP